MRMCCIIVVWTHHRDKPGFTKHEQTEAQIAIYGNIVEALMTLVHAVKHLGYDEALQTVQVTGDDAIVQEQGSIVDEYWETIRSFYTGTIK